jgi:aminoglycoside phosphotransferase (APT) family kinase protein
MEPPQTKVHAAEVEFVRRLGHHLRPSAGTPVLLGEGSNNWVYRLDQDGNTIVIKVGKPHRARVTASEFAKELWCGNAARAVGVQTPAILAVGEFESRPYQVQSFAPGRRPAPDEHGAMWEAIGRWARVIHAVPVIGWGPELIGDGAFSGDWASHVAYNIAALAPDDPLLALGVLDRSTSIDLKRRFERLAQMPFTLGLNHGDLAIPNVLVDDGASGALALIDWGCAGAFPVPHYDINEMIRYGRVTSAELSGFRSGYGLSDVAFAEMALDLSELAALRDIDTLRWALAHEPDAITTYVRHAKRALARLVPHPA